MKKIKVLCQVIVEVELSDEAYQRRHFIIEENGCPGTGVVGAAIDQAIADGDDTSLCWACKLSGNNMIIQDEQPTCRHVDMGDGK